MSISLDGLKLRSLTNCFSSTSRLNISLNEAAPKEACGRKSDEKIPKMNKFQLSL